MGENKTTVFNPTAVTSPLFSPPSILLKLGTRPTSPPHKHNIFDSSASPAPCVKELCLEGSNAQLLLGPWKKSPWLVRGVGEGTTRAGGEGRTVVTWLLPVSRWGVVLSANNNKISTQRKVCPWGPTYPRLKPSKRTGQQPDDASNYGGGASGSQVGMKAREAFITAHFQKLQFSLLLLVLGKVGQSINICSSRSSHITLSLTSGQSRTPGWKII